MKTYCPLILLLIQQIECSVLEILPYIQFELLDDHSYCEILFDLPELELDSWMTRLPIYLTFNQHSCQPGLTIKPLDLNSLECNEAIAYIKNPNVTFLFINENNHELEQYFNDEMFSKLNCMLPKQPYFYVVSQQEDETWIEEIQVFAKSIKLVAKYERVGKSWILDKQSFANVFERRSNFKGSQIIAHYDEYEKYGTVNKDGIFTGYHGEIGTLVKKAFNFTLKLIPIESYGVKIGEKEYSGTVNDLYKGKADMAMANFNHIPERLEVTEGGFSTTFLTNELMYWQDENHGFIYTKVLSMEAWFALSIIIVLSSIGYYLTMQRQKECSYHQIIHFIDAVISNMKAMMILDLNDVKMAHSFTQRTLLATLLISGALLYWHYTGSLISYFTIESEKPPITSFRDILDIPNMKILMKEGNAESQHLLNAMEKSETLRTYLPSRIEWFNSTNNMYKSFMTSEDKENYVLFKSYLYTLNSLKSGTYTLK